MVDVGAGTADLLERPLSGGAAPERDGDRISVRLRPFERVTLRLARA